MDSIIEVKNLGKKYNIGERQKYLALRDVLASIIKSPAHWFGAKLGLSKVDAGDFWALKDINFSVQKGEVLGIIGKNGAGKSTLLKILSRITPPTTGEIKINGRVGSLLEVGTGFHPELTGRENVFLNGAILGMRKKEIEKKFNEIVEFSGIGRFLDTPVKRYSSGMYVRLAFAVAAHLEPEILIVDEVLAVGDVEFQKKCLGKMEDVTKKEGRTILFVSHNLGAVERMCPKSILLDGGKILAFGPTKNIIATYLSEVSNLEAKEIVLPAKELVPISFTKVTLVDNNKNLSSSFEINEKIIIKMQFKVKEEINSADISVSLKNSRGVDIMFASISDANDFNFYNFKPGNYEAEVEIPANFLMPDIYNIRLSAHYPGVENIDTREDAAFFKVYVKNSFREINYGLGCVVSNVKWQINRD